jgi:hypothetical protein
MYEDIAEVSDAQQQRETVFRNILNSAAAHHYAGSLHLR